MSFEPDFKLPTSEKTSALWFIFHKEKLLTKTNAGSRGIPRTSDLTDSGVVPIRKQYLGTLKKNPCFAAELSQADDLSQIFALKGLRELFGVIEEDLIWIAGLANQLVQWNRTHMFCGKCGTPTADKTDERAKICPNCGLINYPRVSPAIIVAVIKEDRILLAHSPRFPAKFYSVLAGFVEPGETLEECIRREVHEEVKICVKNIRYFGSQPWPFPNSLMCAFTAEYADGEIRVDQSEIAEAGWFSADSLPQLPSSISIARRLIDWFVATHPGAPRK